MKIDAALMEFHQNKDTIILAGARRGKANRIIDNWEIPKLEFLQSIVPNIRSNGVAIQWSADITEHANITEIKNLSASSNNHNYESQICQYLDHADKCRQFNLTTAICNVSVDVHSVVMCQNPEDDESDIDDISTGKELKHQANGSCATDTADIFSVINLTSHIPINCFLLAHALQQGSFPLTPLPLWTFVSAETALHLGRDPNYSRMAVDDAAEKFDLPNLHGALAHYLTQGTNRYIHHIGGH